MNFTVYFPPAAEAADAKLPVLFYLSGLTCTDENVIQKSGAQRACAAKGIAFVAPDTSPRGLGVEGEAESWDFGVGAGFYINATVDKWKNWRMYDYITKELPELLAAHFPTLDTSNTAIMGHSMGGHGALTIALKNPGAFKSVSALAPICNPVNVPWGQKAFAGYLGDSDKEAWKQHDASELLASYTGPKFPLLVDTGTSDPFLTRELRPEALEAAAEKAGFPITSRLQDGYDHSYFFIASFIEDHIEHHAKALLG
ncbi:S-formylglutathione hydrolase [Monoraphidium neglectum]|uniref:S-formylglutathione hydrolase n=1 Tax=Monoraphidium neglectum TaxID=145388 RepID=A0A0D2LDM7_9CHLO|nr:S-formylglutathione hydrolase [Monoraphidium neglectum]KIZ04814.1 S-formylglutathione hydrolase [Monoraphidium neglectum]|eukprot:XP_013903833.1 S-formylglutathione hydrolase [Monoraphidium neglectum]